MKAYLALIKIDLKLALRQRSVIFFNYLFPLIFFFVFAQALHADQGGMITQVVTMVSVIGILGNGLFGAGVRAVQERENNILRRYKVAPISPVPLLVASMVTGLLTYLPYIVLMLVLAHFRYGMVFPSNVISVLLFASFGLVAFRAVGLTVASVVNSMQESAIITQVLYMSMLFLSGASFPITMFPKWLLTLTQFIPATYLVSGLQGIMLRGESVAKNGPAVGALCLTTAVAMFVSVKLFRWEKEEKIKTSAKLWLLAVLAPFLIMGTWQARTQENVVKTRIITRELSRSRTILIRNVRIFTGRGRVVENGAVLIRAGKVAEIYEGTSPDAKVLKAESIEGAGKTVLPGFIDLNVRLAQSGGFRAKPPSPQQLDKQILRELAAYLYSGITAVRSIGDPPDASIKARGIVASGEKLGAQLFFYGDVVPAPKTPEEARMLVNQIARLGFDGLSSVSGDAAVMNAIATECRARHLPVIARTRDLKAVEAALAAAVDGIEGGSSADEIPDPVFARMKQAGITYNPTLSRWEANELFVRGDVSLLNRPMLQQSAPADLLSGTRNLINAPEVRRQRQALEGSRSSLEIAKANLVRAWRSGVTLVTGSGAGTPLVIHGPTVQREIELWVQAGIPPEVALQAATANAAKALHTDKRFGAIQNGMEANLVIVEGNPFTDIRAISSVTSVIFKGERVGRGGLFEED
jgi:imidazolonepropionase-like amidohydrolase/ABC-type multidrug transport system permease subunit